jgi:hypothetical protein
MLGLDCEDSASFRVCRDWPGACPGGEEGVSSSPGQAPGQSLHTRKGVDPLKHRRVDEERSHRYA